jgi:hypothetical protein
MDCYIYSYLFADNQGPDAIVSSPKLEGSISEKVLRIGVGTRPPTDTTIPYLDHAEDIQLSANNAAQIGTSELFHGRTIDPARGNLSLARNWLSICENQHGQLCEVPALETKDAFTAPSPTNLLVINISHMCLSPLPEGARYLALSCC